VNGRVERLRERLEQLEAASFLVSNPVNVSYLTGFESSNAFALVDQEQVRLFTDGRYIEAARALDGLEAVLVERDFAPGLAAALPAAADPPIAFESDHLTVARYATLAETGLELRPTAATVLELRAVKEAEELDEIRRAARIADKVYERLSGERISGRTEREVAWWFEQALHEEGADGVAFDVTVASGPNAAEPHHHTGERTIQAGDTVVVDAGARVEGYCSDCTRTFAVGSLPDELQRAYATCRAAQEAALAEVKAGAETRGLDAIARREIEQEGFDVLHGLGHGVGLEVHELPVLRPTADDTLQAAHVVTVEPGVYLTGAGGVRIEDLVIVTERGAEMLTPFTKELLTLD
jgi:Xaa-Pro aminopeptidase